MLIMLTFFFISGLFLLFQKYVTRVYHIIKDLFTVFLKFY